MTPVLRPLTNGIIRNNFYTPAPLSAEHRQRLLSYSVFYDHSALSEETPLPFLREVQMFMPPPPGPTENSFHTIPPLTMEQKASLTSFGDFSTPDAAKKVNLTTEKTPVQAAKLTWWQRGWRFILARSKK